MLFFYEKSVPCLSESRELNRFPFRRAKRVKRTQKSRVCGSRWAPRVRWVCACLCSRAGPRVCGLILHKVSHARLALKMSNGGRTMHLNVNVEKWHCQSGREPSRINCLTICAIIQTGLPPYPSLIAPVRGDALRRRRKQTRPESPRHVALLLAPLALSRGVCT